MEDVYETFLRLAAGRAPGGVAAIGAAPQVELDHYFASLLDATQASFSNDPRDALARLRDIEHKLSNEFNVDTVFFDVLLHTELSNCYRQAIEIESRFADNLLTFWPTATMHSREKDILLAARHALFFCWQARHITSPLVTGMMGLPTVAQGVAGLITTEVVRAFGCEQVLVKPRGLRRVSLYGEPRLKNAEDVDELLTAVALERAQFQESIARATLDVLNYQIDLASIQQRAVIAEIDAFEADLRNWRSWAHSLNVEPSHDGVD